jgi:hypothetical protein
MTTLTHAKLPTQEQINKQFTHGEIHKSLAYYNKIKRQNGEYQFGDLTQQWYGPNSTWMQDVNTNYDPNAQQAIVGYIVGFLNTKPDPTPFNITWGPPGAERSITLSPSGTTIQIVGYMPPPTDAELKALKG